MTEFQQDIIRQPGSAELVMGGKPPDSKSADIDIHPVPEGKHQVGQAIMGEGIRFREYRAVSQDSALWKSLEAALRAVGSGKLSRR